MMDHRATSGGSAQTPDHQARPTRAAHSCGAFSGHPRPVKGYLRLRASLCLFCLVAGIFRRLPYRASISLNRKYRYDTGMHHVRLNTGQG